MVCPPVKPYSQALLDRVAEELVLLPPGSATEVLLGDYHVMRQQARSCARG